MRTILTSLLLCVPLVAQGETWSFDETTTGNPISFTSPTSVNPNAAAYDTVFEIQTVEVTVEFLSLPFGPFDVTDQIPPEQQSTEASILGPAPISIFSDSIVFPEPPEPTTIAADLNVGLSGSGFGQFNATNVVLGTVLVDLPIFGEVTADLTSVRIAGQVTVNPTQWFDLGFALAGTHGEPLLVGDGTLVGGEPVSLTLTNALENSPAFLVIGFTQINLPVKGGVLVPSLDLTIELGTDGTGSIPLASTWPTGVPSGFVSYLQYWIVDLAGPKKLSASNGLSATAP